MMNQASTRNSESSGGGSTAAGTTVRTESSGDSTQKGKKTPLGSSKTIRIKQDLQDKAAITKGVTDKAFRRQLFLTSCGAALIVLSFIVGASTFMVTQLGTSDALLAQGEQIRKNIGEMVMKEVARTLQPVYASTRRLQEQARYGAATGSKVWPPTAETFLHGKEELAANLWVQLESDLHLRKVSADGAHREKLPVLGIMATIALKEDLQTFATNMGECAYVFTLDLVAFETTTSVNAVVSDSPFKLFVQSVARRDANGTARPTTEVSYLDVRTKRLTPVFLQMPGIGCELMWPMWGDDQMQEPFDDFFWHGPSMDVYKAFRGNAPLYSSDGQHKIGYFGTGISVVWSTNPVLKKIVKDGGDFTRGAELEILSESGMLLGASEFDANSSTKYAYISDVPADSFLREAARLIEEKVGSPCPSSYTSLDLGERLMDATPFYTEDYGMPPVNERWCVITTFPRENIYEAIDTTGSIKTVGASINFMLFFLAIVLFIVSMVLARRSDRGLRSQKVMGDLRQVFNAMKEVHSLSSPIVLVPATAFLELPKLESYESLRDKGLIVVLDSVQDVIKFKQSNMILFLSHQWLSVYFPDAEDGTQLAAMKGAVQTVLNEPLRNKEVYVWCDFTSIPQKHVKMQRAAVNSLPVYASMADKFIVIAPPAVHEETGCECNLVTYNKRGWCRAEMLAKACGSGIDELYTCTDMRGTLSAVTQQDLSQLSMNIFEGDFTVMEDVEGLVQPTLGLYSLVLRNRDLPHMQLIYSHIQEDKEKFFPKNYFNKVHQHRVELFGHKVSLLESYIARGGNDAAAASGSQAIDTGAAEAANV